VVEEEFTWFVRRRGPALRRTAYLLTGDVGRAEDLVQTALVALWLKQRRVAAANWEAYVRRTLINISTSWWRLRSSTERPTANLPERPAAGWTDAVDERVLLVNALRQLSARQRAAVVLRHYEDMSEADTARMMGCSVGTVKSLASRGLDRLRQLLPADSLTEDTLNEELS
jgi:RNA polymerase sigma-70 factor (sigma-E family)